MATLGDPQFFPRIILRTAWSNIVQCLKEFYTGWGGRLLSGPTVHSLYCALSYLQKVNYNVYVIDNIRAIDLYGIYILPIVSL